MQFSIGCDIEETSNFIKKNKNDVCLKKIFTKNEIDYCFSKNNPEQHLTARFCAKEATIKALNPFGINIINIKNIEIKNYKNGSPYIRIKDYDTIKIQVSLSHTKDYAVAFVIINKE